MDGRNALGRRISLLNDPVDSEKNGRTARLTSLAFRSARTSSYASSHLHSPNSSPPTPGLVRSDSSDSSAMNRTPSPETPSFIDYTGMQPSAMDSKQPQQPFQVPSAFFNPPTDPSVQSYPPIPTHHAAQFTYPAPPAIAPQPQGHQGHQGHSNPLTVATDSQQPGLKGPVKQQTKKNHYPCPLAKQYNCNDHFTTSGHAARHAKKHTGKKDAFCPECNKAFTRKDNMEQHRRTHQNGRSATKSGGESSAKRQKTAKRASIASISSDTKQQLVGVQSGMPAPMLDPSLPESPASSFGFSDASFVPQPQPPHGMPMASYPDPMMQTFQTPFPVSSPNMALDPALSQITGLDTLAMAAAKRDQDY